MPIGNARSSGYDKAEDSWYQEGREAIDMLLDNEGVYAPVWDPACGEGNIPKACAARGIKAKGSDLVYRGYGKGGVDFLKSDKPFEGSIVSNPPFDLMEPFIHHAIEIGSQKICLIGRLAFLEGQRRKASLFDVTPPARVLVFSKRISMPPGGRGIEPKGGSIAFAWYVWEKDWPTGRRTELMWLGKKNPRSVSLGAGA